MRKIVVTGIGHADFDYESSGLRVNDNYVCVRSLIDSVGAEALDSTQVRAFEHALDDAAADEIIAAAPVQPADGFTEWYNALSDEDQERWSAGQTAAFYRNARVEYRAKSGREFPKVYRMTVTVEAEPLSDEESLAYWRKQNVRSDGRRVVGDMMDHDWVDKEAIKIARDAVENGYEISFYNGAVIGEPHLRISARDMSDEFASRIKAFPYVEYQETNPNFDCPQWFIHL